jgi:lantibiotic transport system permease protein
MKYISSLQSEWLKTKGSAASWLCIIGGFFIPTIFLIAFLVKGKTINEYEAPGINSWKFYFGMMMNNMQMFLLPMGVMLASSMITQLEYKNNTWKQLHTTPQSYTNIFFAKFSVVLLMTLKFFLFFNIGLIISAIVPSLVYAGGLPKQSFPVSFFLEENSKIFIACLPILGIQYLISLQFKNFLVSIGVGLVALIGTLIGLGVKWEYLYFSPYSYVLLNGSETEVSFNIFYRAFSCFGILLVAGYFLYLNKKEKG